MVASESEETIEKIADVSWDGSARAARMELT
jgi:hypothetical protein